MDSSSSHVPNITLLSGNSSESQKTKAYQNNENHYNSLFHNLKNLSSDDGDMVLEANVRKELCSVKSGTRVDKYKLIDTVLSHIPQLKLVITMKHADDASRLDAIRLMPLDPVKTPAPLIADVALDLAKILRRITTPPAGACGKAVKDFLDMVTVAEERGLHSAKEHLLGVANASYNPTPKMPKLRLHIETCKLVVPLNDSAQTCPCCNHCSAMPVMTQEEVDAHNAATAAKFEEKMTEWHKQETNHGRPRRAGDLAPITLPYVCQCKHLRCANAGSAPCSCDICICQCNYQFHEGDPTRRRARKRDGIVPQIAGASQLVADSSEFGEKAAKRKRAWFEAAAARDALIESKENMLEKVEAELHQLKTGGGPSGKIERLKIRVDRLAREILTLEEEDCTGVRADEGGMQQASRNRGNIITAPNKPVGV